MVVLSPFGDNQRYDLVVEKDGKFDRIQCKTGRVRQGRIMFNACSSRIHNSYGKYDYKGQIEYFGVYCPDNDKSYLIPIDEVGTTVATLRIEPTKNCQKKGIRLASDFEI